MRCNQIRWEVKQEIVETLVREAAIAEYNGSQPSLEQWLARDLLNAKKLIGGAADSLEEIRAINKKMWELL